MLVLFPDQIFYEACFKIVDPQAEKEEGDVLRFGQEISLVDDRGMVWNNKDGRFHGRLGPSIFGKGGREEGLRVGRWLEASAVMLVVDDHMSDAWNLPISLEDKLCYYGTSISHSRRPTKRITVRVVPNKSPPPKKKTRVVTNCHDC